MCSQGRRRHVRSPVSSLKMRFRSTSNGFNDGEIQPYCLTDVGLSHVGEGFRKLERLSLIWCSNVSSVGLISFAKQCRGLKYLDLQVITHLLPIGNSIFNEHFAVLGISIHSTSICVY